jgi:hypothetical protein
VDPAKREVWTAEEDGLHQHEAGVLLPIPGIDGEADFAEIFEELNF